MITLGALICLFTLASAFDDTFCDKDKVLCHGNFDIDFTVKHILYDVNPPEGFNLRRDVYMRFAIMLAKAKTNYVKNKWRLILPPWDNMYHWKASTQKSKPLPWRHFFDVNALQSFAPVVEFDEYLENTKSDYVKVDHLYVLQNFENPFENGVFEEKYKVVGNCVYNVSNDKIRVKEVICVKFQGKISKLWELIASNPKDTSVMFAHGEIPLHDSYGDGLYWSCRKSMVFSDPLVEAATKYMRDTLKCYMKMCTSYISIHWRRQDFARSRSKDVPSVTGTAKQIDDIVRNTNLDLNEVFIATDADQSELQLLKTELKNMGYMVYYYTPTADEIQRYKDGGIAIIEQIICSHAATFIGTHESTFTYRIQEERELLGFRTYTTFNRFCPDKGDCERPSVWKFVE